MVKLLVIAVIVLSILTILSVLYIIFLELQLHSINKQLVKRLTEKTHQLISLQLFDRGLNVLVININRCLKSEEDIRLEIIRNEKNFKDMIANISHDLRTPLTAIKGYQQLIAKDPLSISQKEKLDIAQKHADELGNLIEHFFEYSYLVSADIKVNITKINLTNLVTECIAGAVSSFEERGISVHIVSAPQIFVLSDDEMLVRIIQNLTRNCVMHSAGNVEVNIFKRGKDAVVSFKNHVENTDEIDINRLFDRFYTGDPSRHRSTGLGLSIVKLLAEKAGGSVGANLKNNVIEIYVKLVAST